MTLTQKEVEARCLEADHPALLLEEYKGALIKHKYRFLACGHEWGIAPYKLHAGRGCGACYLDQGSTYLYLMEHDGLDAFKIGITAVKHKEAKRSRIRQHSRKGWELVFKLQVETRAEAETIEKRIIESWRDQGFPQALESGTLRNGGEGETVSRQLIHVNEIINRIQE